MAGQVNGKLPFRRLLNSTIKKVAVPATAKQF